MNKETEQWIEENNPYNEPNPELIWNAKFFAWEEGATKMAEHIQSQPPIQTSTIPKDLNNAITEWGEQFEKIKIEERYLRRTGQYTKNRRCNNAQRKNKRKKRK